MRGKIKRNIVVTYKNHDERDKRIKDLLDRGYTIVSEGEKVRTDNFYRNYKPNAKHKGSVEVRDFQSKYVVMRMPDEMYAQLKEKYSKER